MNNALMSSDNPSAVTAWPMNGLEKPTDGSDRICFVFPEEKVGRKGRCNFARPQDLRRGGLQLRTPPQRFEDTKMATLYFDKKIGVDAATAWKKLADVGSIHKLLSILDSARLDGDQRVCTLKAGLPSSGELKEVIFSVDENLKRVAYGIVSSPFGFTNHAASMQIVPDGEGKARFVWTNDVKPDAVAEAMGGVFAQEAEHIARALE
jgi:carbon monoxide dehydrogenase subunit G